MRRGATRRPSSLRGHYEGIQRSPLPSPGCGHKLLLEYTRWGFTLSFPGGEMEGWLPTSRDESGVKPSLHLMAFPACSAQPRGRHVGLGAGASLGSSSTFASNFLCGRQMPSPVWVSEMETPLSIAVTKVYKTTNVKVAYNCFAPVKTITVATLLLSCPQQHPSLNCSPFANQLLSEPEAQNSPSPEVSSLQVRVPSPHLPVPKAGFLGTRDPLVPRTPT